MPELPDVEVFRQYLNATSLHKTITDVEVKHRLILGNVTAEKIREGLRGRKMESSKRRGKHILIHLDDDNWFTLHFGMTGRLKYFKHLQDAPEHDRLRLEFKNGYHLAYVCVRLLGEVNLVDGFEEFIGMKDLGPDALRLNLTQFRDIMEGRRGMVKTTLMNQSILSGVGNIYADEMLFQSGIHPETKIKSLPEEKLKLLFDKMREVLKTAIEKKANPDDFPEDFIIPHRDEGETCPICGGELVKTRVSGRATYHCPRCQKR